MFWAWQISEMWQRKKTNIFSWLQKNYGSSIWWIIRHQVWAKDVWSKSNDCKVWNFVFLFDWLEPYDKPDQIVLVVGEEFFLSRKIYVIAKEVPEMFLKELCVRRSVISLSTDSKRKSMICQTCHCLSKHKSKEDNNIILMREACWKMR